MTDEKKQVRIERRCGNCFHYVKSGVAISQGECRFAPPTPMPAKGGIASAFPPVKENLFCAQFSPSQASVLKAQGVSEPAKPILTPTRTGKEICH